MWAEKVHSTPATVTPARIEDAGEKLWGARKDDEHLSNSVAAEVDWLDQLWPKLQYNNLDGDNDDKYLNGAIEMDQKEGVVGTTGQAMRNYSPGRSKPTCMTH